LIERKLRGRGLAVFLTLEVIVTVALGVSLLVLPYLQEGMETEPISLKDIIEDPGSYLGERNVTLTLTRIEPRDDPYHRFAEQYYLAYVKDEEGYERPFVISEKDKSTYQGSVGNKAVFELEGSIGPHLIHPPDKLITNILLSARADPYSREYYTISIRLMEPLDGGLPKQRIVLTYLAAFCIAATTLTSIVFFGKRKGRCE